MKIFYLSTVCSTARFEEIVSKSKKQPSASAQTFEMSFLKGFENKNDIELDMNSFVPVPAFPGGYKLFWGRKREEITKGIETKWLPALNLQIAKQMCFKHFTAKYLRKWLKKNKEDKDKCVVMYSLYGPVAKPALKLCKKYNCKCFVFIADLPNLQFTTSKPTGIKGILAPILRGSAVNVQDDFDGYIFFTKQMSEVIGKGKPYEVIEAVCDAKAFDEYEGIAKSEKPSLMYAGMLYKKYGINFLIDAFMNLKGDYELWLFGDGDYVDEIKKCAKIDNRIKFFGRVSREEVLKYEKQAHLLVNVRSDREEYTKYSFPSKTMEYILSGTPVLTSKLPGIPEEYYEYVYTTDSCETETLAKRLEEILNLTEAERAGFGEKGRKWLAENKNAKIQTDKLIKFIRKVID